MGAAGGGNLGAYQVGVILNLADLVGRVGTVENVLGRIEKSIDSLDAKGKAAGGGWLKGASQLYIAEQAVKGVAAALNLIPAALNKSVSLFDDTVGAAGRYAKTLEIQATMVGSSVRQTQDLSAGLTAITGSGDAATTVLLRLSRAVGAASGGQLRIPPKQAFHELGVALTDAEGRGRPFGELMDELEAKFNRFPEGPRRTALALAIFGFQGGKLLELFKELGASGKTYQQSVEDLGLTISGPLLDAAAKLDTQLNILGLQGAQTWRLIGAEAAPAFVPLIQELIQARKEVIDWIKANKEGIERVAGTFAEKVSTILTAIKNLSTALKGLDFEDTVVQGVDLAALSMLKLARAVGSVSVGLATVAGLVNAVNYATAGADPAKGWHAATDEAFGYVKTLNEVIDKTETELAASRQHTAYFERNRDVLHGLFVEYQRVNAEQHGLNSAAHLAQVDQETHLLDQMRDRVAALGASYTKLPEEQRAAYEKMGLHAPTVEAPKPEAPDQPGAKVPKYDQAAIESATKAIEKATEAAEKERAAIIGGAQAKIAATVASKEFAAASDTMRASLERALTLLDESTKLQTRLKTLADTAKSTAEAGFANQLKLEKEALQIQLDRAKAEGNVREEARLTTAVKQAELDEELAKEKATYTQLTELRQALANADKSVVDTALRQLEEVGLAREADGANELGNAQARLDQLLGLYQDYVQKRQALDKQAAAAAGQAIADQKKDIIDLRDTFLSVVDDMNEGLILGTKKMSQVWMSAWQSLEKQAEKAILNTALDLSGINTKFSLTDFVKGLGGGGGGAGAAAGAAGGAGGLLGTIGGWFKGTPNPNAPGVSPEVAGPPAPGGAGTAAAGEGFFGGIGKLLSGLGGGGGAQTVGTMTVNAGTVLLNGGITGAPAAGAPGAPGEPGAPGAPGAPAAGAAVPGLPAPGGPPPEPPGGAQPGGGTAEAVSGLKDTFEGVGTKLLKPLLPLENLLSSGFAKSVSGLASVGQSLGGALAGIGGLIKGNAGQVVQLVGSIISVVTGVVSAIVAMTVSTVSSSAAYVATIVSTIWGAAGAIIAGDIKVLGSGQTGGYFENGALTRPAGTSPGQDRSGTIHILAHPGEGLINPDATKLIGGKSAIMALNAGLIPPSLAAIMANGLSVRMPAMPGAFGGGGLSQLNSAVDNSVTIHPGAFVLNVPEGVNGEDFGRSLMKGVISHFGR